MQRESMIDLLVLDCFERMADSSRGIWLLSVLREGFVGFDRMSDGQLKQEMARRGLRVDAGSMEVEADEWELPDTDPDLQLALAATGARTAVRD
jgi:hypothetical protein